jgi:hypothetical protein
MFILIFSLLALNLYKFFRITFSTVLIFRPTFDPVCVDYWYLEHLLLPQCLWPLFFLRSVLRSPLTSQQHHWLQYFTHWTEKWET